MPRITDKDKDYLPFNFTSDECAELVRELNAKRKTLTKYNQQTPYGMSMVIETLSEMLAIIGDLHSQAVHKNRKAYADRKQKQGEIIGNKDGRTVKERENDADARSYKERLAEARYEAEETQWSNLWKSTQELINAKKKTHEVIMAEYYGKTK